MGRKTNKRIDQYLSSNGDGTGTIDIIGAHATPTRYYIQPEEDEVYVLWRTLVQVHDSNGMSATEHGNLGIALANGIIIQEATNGIQTHDLTAGQPIKINADWAGKCYDTDIKTWGVGDEILASRWTFNNAGVPVVLDGSVHESLDIVVNDDFTGLIEHRFLIQGYIL